MGLRAEGPDWCITVDTSEAMLVALYLRDVAGLAGAGLPALPPARPKIRPASPHQLTADVGGECALRAEWEAWWHQLVRGTGGIPDDDFPGSPALSRLLRAHRGSALDWARERSEEYRSQSLPVSQGHQMLKLLVEDRLLAVGSPAEPMVLSVIELPLAEHRAWFVEPGTLLMSRGLANDVATYVTYVQPVIELLLRDDE